MLAAIIDSLGLRGLTQEDFVSYAHQVSSGVLEHFPGGDSGTQAFSILHQLLSSQILSIQPMDGERESGIMPGRPRSMLITFT